MTDPIQLLWSAGGADARAPSPTELRVRARRLRRRTRLRDAVEYASGMAGAGVFAFYWTNAANGLVAAGCALVILGTMVVMAGLWRRRVRAASDAAAEAGVGYLRGQLAAHRDALAGVARWYLAPVVPGLVTFLAGVGVDIAERRGGTTAAIATGATLAFVIGVFALVLVANRRAARALDAEIAALDHIHS